MKGRWVIDKWRKTERYILLGSRFLTVAAVVGSLASSVLMFCLGLYDIFLAFERGLKAPTDGLAEISPGALSVINVIEGLDRFLIGIVLLYFAYGVYSLFIRPEEVLKEVKEELALPVWMRVTEVGQLKQVVAELIVVIIFVLFLRVALQLFQSSDLTLNWQQIFTLLLLPACTALLGLSLKLIELHPKPSLKRKNEKINVAEKASHNDARR